MDRLSQIEARPRQMATHGAGGDSHRPRNFVVGFPFEPDQEYRLSLGVWHPAERATDVSQNQPSVAIPRPDFGLRIGVNLLSILGAAGLRQAGEELMAHDGDEPCT